MHAFMRLHLYTKQAFIELVCTVQDSENSWEMLNSLPSRKEGDKYMLLQCSMKD